MEVVNVRCADIRPQYQNLAEWCKDEKNVYIGRRGVVFISSYQGVRIRYPPRDSVWANPYKIVNDDRDECLRKYREHIISKIDKENLIPDLLLLKGKILGCWCAPEPCHGNILQELIEIYDV